MFARTVTTLAKAVRRTRKLTSYGQFLRETRNHPKLRGLAIAARGRTVAKLFRALSPAEKNALKSRGSKVTIVVRPRGALRQVRQGQLRQGPQAARRPPPQGPRYPVQAAEAGQGVTRGAGTPQPCTRHPLTLPV
jgi:hypothetical protein